jgi:hypothetical protein
MSRVGIVTFAPSENADSIRRALGEAGAGVLGDYTFCSFSVNGIGRYLPSRNSDPHIGQPGEFQSVKEERIEVKCDREVAKKAIEAMKKAHPYEEVAFDVYPLIEESDL